MVFFSILISLLSIGQLYALTREELELLTLFKSMQTPPTPLVINVNTAQESHLNSQAQQAQATKAVTPSALPLKQLPEEHYTISIPTIAHILDLTKKLCSAYKWYIIGTACVGVYSYIYARLLWIAYIQQRKHFWAQWNTNISITNLTLVQQQKYAQELFDAINQRYQEESQDNFLRPLALFVQDVEREQQQLRNFIKFYDLLQKTKLATIFPNYQHKINQAHKKIERLEYYKNLLLHWISEYKVEQTPLVTAYAP